MDHKRYAPIIGKELTLDMLKALMEDIRRDIHAENSTRTRIKRKKPVLVRSHSEDDGA